MKIHLENSCQNKLINCCIVGSFSIKHLTSYEKKTEKRQENKTSKMHHLDSYIYKHSLLGKCITIIKYF